MTDEDDRTRACRVLHRAARLPAPCYAQQYPTKPVRIIMPFAAGGPTDMIARIVAQKLSERLGQQFYIENQAGAGGNIGTEQVARARGGRLHDAGGQSPASWSTRASTPRCRTIRSRISRRSPGRAASPNVLVVHPVGPAKTIKELVEPDQGRARQIQLASAWRRLDAASVGRNVQARLRSRPRHGAVHRRGARDELDDRRPHADRLHRAAAGNHATSRKASCAGSRCSPTSASPRCRTSRPSRKLACATRRPIR